MSGECWDAIVIGAGPAGSVAARQLAIADARVLLVDHAPFPRAKVCGCCLGAAAIRALGELGLGGMIAGLGGAPIRRFELRCGDASAGLPLSGGVAIARDALDAALVEEARAHGVVFRDATSAAVAPADSRGARCVELSGSGGREHARARLVIVADGISGRSLAGCPEFAWRVRRNSRIGFGAMTTAPLVSEGTILMCCARDGYLGAVALSDQRVNLAAAMDLEFVRSRGGPGPAAAALARSAGLDPPDLEALAWKGAPALSRRRRVEGDRLLVIGDAAGYVEPFTGEGMTWAVVGARAAASSGLRIIGGGYAAGDWAAMHRRAVAARQAACAGIAWALRRPALTRAAIRLLARAPAIAGPILASAAGAAPKPV